MDYQYDYKKKTGTIYNQVQGYDAAPIDLFERIDPDVEFIISKAADRLFQKRDNRWYTCDVLTEGPLPINIDCE